SAIGGRGGVKGVKTKFFEVRSAQACDVEVVEVFAPRGNIDERRGLAEGPNAHVPPAAFPRAPLRRGEFREDQAGCRRGGEEGWFAGETADFITRIGRHELAAFELDNRGRITIIVAKGRSDTRPTQAPVYHVRSRIGDTQAGAGRALRVAHGDFKPVMIDLAI